MSIKIDWIETRKPDWKVATITENGKQMEGVSINRHDKHGRILFSNFDQLAAGMELEGELSQSATGKWYLYPPKAETSVKSAYRPVKPDMTAMMNKKDDSITKFQNNKDESIKISSTMRDAVLLAIAEYHGNESNSDPLDVLIKKWREILWREWENYKDFSPF